MDATSFDTALAALLADPDGLAYTPGLRMQAAWQAVRAYSNYKSLLRRFGYGSLAAAAAPGDVTLKIVGGVWMPGNLFALGQYPEIAEICAVSSVAPVPAAGLTAMPYLLVTLAAPVAQTHGAGSPARPTAPGLAIVAGVDNYPLPIDWVRPEQESFDLAIGAKASVHREDGFYDASYGITNNLSGVGYAGQSNWGPAWAGGFPIAGDPFYNPNGAPGGVGSQPQGVTWRFLPGSRPEVVVSPAPVTPALLDFYYWGCHVMETIPDADAEPVLHYAKAECLKGLASEMAGTGDFKEGQSQYMYSKNAQGLMEQAAAAMEVFDLRMRFRAVGASG